ncbi:MAG: CDP-glycerol glycerophosphotransferase family protein [Clostridia bacterium]|nr:CDP-glycerol glycerophosphotransferase family protein [Clostridia bacterium]
MIRKILLKLKKMLGRMKRTLLYYYIWPYFYKKEAKKPIDEKKVLLVAGNFDRLPDNLLCIKAELEKRGFNCVEVYPVKGGGFLEGFKRNNWFQKEYATSAYVFLEDFFFPLYANQPREGTRVVQLWHACGAFKKWGYSTVDLAWGSDRATMDRYPIHNTYTDVSVSSDKIIPYYAEAFNCSESIIKPLGVPRTDVYFDNEFVSSCRDELLKMFPEIGERKIILYAPTFRGNSTIESYMDLKLDIAAMMDALSEDYVLVYKLHPQTAKAFSLSEEEKEKYKNFVFDISTSMRVDVALCAADVLISDYSSVIFEYSLMSRPMIFFAYDLEEYDATRSFYNKYEDFVPGPIVRDTDGIIESVKKAETDFDVKQVEAFREYYMSACDGHSTQRIADEIIG